MNNCSHTKTSGKYFEREIDWFTQETEIVWETTTEYTTIDLDTHRYKCTQCHKIMYYSEAARASYEDGEPSGWITGVLDND